MSKTIRQLSEKLKLSKQAINQRISSIQNFRSKHTHKVKNHLKIDDQGIKILVNFDRKKRQPKNGKQNKTERNLNAVFLKQLDVKDQQISKLQKYLDQQQLQLATLAENRQLKDYIQKSSSLLEASNLIRYRQVVAKNNNLSNRKNQPYQG